MRRSGLVHLLSVSGLHVGLVAVLVWGALNLAGVSPSTRRWLVIAALVGFSLLAGGNAPVRRAAAAGIAYLLGPPARPAPGAPAHGVGHRGGAGGLEPAVVLQPGFELSAFVTLALVRWITPLASFLHVLPQRIAQALAVALVAQAASTPLVGGYFAVVPPLGVVANLLAAPLELLLVGASLLALAVAPLSSSLGGSVLLVVAGGQWLLDRASTVGGLLSWPFPPFPAALAVVLAVLGLAALTRARFALARRAAPGRRSAGLDGPAGPSSPLAAPGPGAGSAGRDGAPRGEREDRRSRGCGALTRGRLARARPGPGPAP